MSSVERLLGIAKSYRTVLKAIDQWHADNLCNLGRGSDGCYCLELKQRLLNEMGDALSV